jgi:hypothetical protein
MRILTSAIVLLLGVVVADPTCRFAPIYTKEGLISNPSLRTEFLSKVLEKEAKFIKEIATDARTGLALYGQHIDSRTGMPKA